MWHIAEWRFVGHVCLRNPSPLFFVGIPSIHSLREAGSWEPQYVPPVLHHFLHYACKSSHPFVEDSGFVAHAEKHRSGQCRGLQGLLGNIAMSNVFFFSHLPCRLLKCVEIELLATGYQPFSCPCSRNVTNCWKEICSTCLSKECMPFAKSKLPLPTRSLRFRRGALRSTSSASWLHHAHPFVAAAETSQAHAEKQRVRRRSCGLQDLLRNIPISDVSMWPLQNTELFWRLSFLTTEGWKCACLPSAARVREMWLL